MVFLFRMWHFSSYANLISKLQLWFSCFGYGISAERSSYFKITVMVSLFQLLYKFCTSNLFMQCQFLTVIGLFNHQYSQYFL